MTATPPRGSSARTPRVSRDTATAATRLLDEWWAKHADAASDDVELYHLLDARIELVSELHRLLRHERASVVRRMRTPTGSLREASARTGRAESTLRSQAALGEATP